MGPRQTKGTKVALNEAGIAHYDQLKRDNDARTARISAETGLTLAQEGLNLLYNACLLEVIAEALDVLPNAQLLFEAKRENELAELEPQAYEHARQRAEQQAEAQRVADERAEAAAKDQIHRALGIVAR